MVDPTGCGDAYRAGLLYGIANGWDWEKTGRLAALMGAIKIAHRGGQNHRPSRDEIAERYRQGLRQRRPGRGDGRAQELFALIARSGRGSPASTR